jgi:hypothetical protein
MIRRPRYLIASVCALGILSATLITVDNCNSEDSKTDQKTLSLFPAPRGYVCYQLPGPIKIDGKIDDPAWQNIPWSENFRDIEGDLRPEPPLKTRVKMAWDNQGLYVAAELEEPHVWATLKEHDSVIFQDNDFEMFLDPDADSQFYGELELNALNTTWDLLLTRPYKNHGLAINGWEIIGLQTAVNVDGTLNTAGDKDRGWTVEIFWPWKGIKEISRCAVPPKNGDQWRVNFSRVEWDVEIKDGRYVKIPNRLEHNWVWSPQGAIDMHRPDRWGILQFSSEAIGKTVLRPDPAQPARDYLHRIHYAQTELNKNGRPYSALLKELNVRPPDGMGLSNPLLEVAGDGYQASVELVVHGKLKRWRIDHDARIRAD